MGRNWRQRRRRNIGNKARQRLPLLMDAFESKCFWCQQTIVMMRSVPRDAIISVDHGSVTYRDGDTVVQALLASVDHKIGLIDGGTNDMDNLVPSCRYCNEERGRQRESIIERPSSVLDSDEVLFAEAKGEVLSREAQGRVNSKEILNGKQEVLIDHNGSLYHLSITPHNGLRLYK